jgi:hypothetical protein
MNAFGTVPNRGISQNMFLNEIGCVGKLPFTSIERLKALMGRPGSAWLDVEPLPELVAPCVSIDTVVVDHKEPSSFLFGILHSLNDVLAAGATPASVSLSLQLAETCAWTDLERIEEVLSAFQRVANCGIAKVHTSQAGELSYVTAAVVGTNYSRRRLPPSPAGILVLVGDVTIPKFPSDTARDAWITEALEDRRRAAGAFDGPMKDISGDGLAGALYQLAKAESCYIELNVDLLQEEAFDAPLDDCRRDRNYNDYGDLISNFDANNTAKIREVLFSPRFFGPIVCLSSILPSGSPGREIGTYRSGEVGLACV